MLETKQERTKGSVGDSVVVLESGTRTQVWDSEYVGLVNRLGLVR